MARELTTEEDWYPKNAEVACDIAGSLHEHYYQPSSSKDPGES